MPYTIVTQDGIEISGIPDNVPQDSLELKQRVQDERRKLQATQTPQEIALAAGAQPGIALTELQKQAIQRGERIQPSESSLEQIEQESGGFEPFTGEKTDQGAVSAGIQQGMINIGSGILRSVNELRAELGDEGAKTFLQNLESTTPIQQKKTEIQTEGQPIKRFFGEVIGETIGMPFGGGGATAVRRLASGMAAGGAGGFLSAFGRGEDVSEAGAEATFGALAGGTAGGILEGVSALRRANTDRLTRANLGGADVDDLSGTIENIAEDEAAQAATGIRTFPAQKTLNPFQLEQQSFIGQSQQSATKAFNALKQQNRESGEAVSDLLNQIATPQVAETAASRARRKSKGIINAREAIRKEATSPIYKQAFRRQRQGLTGKVGTESVVNKADGIIRSFGEESNISKAIGKYSRQIKNADGDLQKLHGIKMQIDDVIEKMHSSDSSIGTTTARFLNDLQSDLVTTMNQASPSYNAARQEFARQSPQVDAIRDGVFGRVSKLKDLNLQKASRTIFDPTLPIQTSVNAIKTLKGVQGGREVAQGLVRNELERRLSGMRSTLTDISQTGGRNIENIPLDLLNKLYGKGKEKDVLFAALKELSPQALQNAKWLQTSLKRASSGRPGGSQTGIRAEIRDKLKGIGFAIRNVFRAPAETVAGLGEDAVYNRNTRALGDVLYDPTWQADMNALRRLDPNSDEAQSAFEKLLRKAVEANEMTGIGRQAGVVSARKEREL